MKFEQNGKSFDEDDQSIEEDSFYCSAVYENRMKLLRNHTE